MRASLIQAGSLMRIDCRDRRIDRVIAEACGSALSNTERDENADVDLVIEGSTEPFDRSGWQPLTRGAHSGAGEVLLENACGSGFDLRITVLPHQAWAKIRVEARYRPPAKERIAARVLPSRFQLLARAVLLQYPALWVAGTRGRVPVHAGVVQLDGITALLGGPGGVGRSTLLMQAVEDGAAICADNLCVTDGRTVHGVVEPVRMEGVGGRRMPHGRGECALPARVSALVPDRIIVVSRRLGQPPRLSALSARRAAFVLTAGTYAAGELRRYWGFAAVMALGTGRGPAHPPVESVMAKLTRLDTHQLTLGPLPAPRLRDLLGDRIDAAS